MTAGAARPISSLPEAEVFGHLLSRYPALAPLEGDIVAAFELLASTFQGGGKVLVCGNGGSAADAEHIVGELMKTMASSRRLSAPQRQAFQEKVAGPTGVYLSEHLEGALPTIALGAHTALATAVQNDTAGDMVFAQQVYGYGRPGDLLWVFSTSGRSRNVVLAAATAMATGMRLLAFTGESESPLGETANVVVRARLCRPRRSRSSTCPSTTRCAKRSNSASSLGDGAPRRRRRGFRPSQNGDLKNAPSGAGARRHCRYARRPPASPAHGDDVRRQARRGPCTSITPRTPGRWRDASSRWSGISASTAC